MFFLLSSSSCRGPTASGGAPAANGVVIASRTRSCIIFLYKNICLFIYAMFKYILNIYINIHWYTRISTNESSALATLCLQRILTTSKNFALTFNTPKRMRFELFFRWFLLDLIRKRSGWQSTVQPSGQPLLDQRRSHASAKFSRPYTRNMLKSSFITCRFSNCISNWIFSTFHVKLFFFLLSSYFLLSFY